jgi:hypothetical protein
LEGKGAKGDKAAPSEQTVVANDTIGVDRHPATIPLDIWPESTETIFGLDIAKLRRSPAGALTTAWLRSKKLGLVTSLPSSCQSRLVDSIDSMLVIQGFKASNENVVLAIRGIERVEFEKCAPVIVGTGNQRVDDYALMSDDPDKGVGWWYDDNTMLFAPKGGKELIDTARPDAPKKRLPTGGTLLQAISRTNTRAAVWAASVPTPDGSLADTFVELHGWADFSDGLNSTWNVRYETSELSKEAGVTFEENIKPLNPFAKYMESFEARPDGQWLRLRFSMTRPLLNELADESFFKMLLPDDSGL